MVSYYAIVFITPRFSRLQVKAKPRYLRRSKTMTSGGPGRGNEDDGKSTVVIFLDNSV